MTLKNQHPVPVVRLVIPDASGKVLILKRSNTSHEDGAWCLPGGKVDYGDTVEESAAKEVQEETSLRCVSVRFLFHQDSLPASPGGMHCINLYFECAVTGSIALNRESSAFAWIGPDELEEYELVFRNDDAMRKYWGGGDADSKRDTGPRVESPGSYGK